MKKIFENATYIREVDRVVVITQTVEEEQFDDTKVQLFSYEAEEFLKAERS